MKPLPRFAPVNGERHANVGADYDRAGERYRAYADGDLDELYHFDGQYGFGDKEIWGRILTTLHELRVRGVRELSVLDLGCGPGTWLRRIIDRARQMGFTNVTARGIDLAEAQVRRARILPHGLASHGDVKLRYEVGDIRARIGFGPTTALTRLRVCRWVSYIGSGHFRVMATPYAPPSSPPAKSLGFLVRKLLASSCIRPAE